MIIGIFHKGSGLGNQLHRYLFTRCKAKELNVDFGMLGVENFKGAGFMNLNMGKSLEGVNLDEFTRFNEARVNHPNGDDIRPYDPLSALIEDNTIVDGEFQDENYWKNYEYWVKRWLAVEPVDMPENVCVINFRGGEYVGIKSLFLPQEYWKKAIAHKEKQGVKYFVVATDDVETARKFFPDFLVKHDMEKDWRMIRYAHHLILSNSSFGILPAWLNENCKEVVAPKFWARRNLGFWALEQNKYNGWKYL